MINHRVTESTEKGNEEGIHSSSLPFSVLSVTLWLTFRKYLRIFRVSLIERLAYRGDFFLATVLRFLPMVTTILLWGAIYQGAKETSGTTELAGYDYHEMIAYLLLTHVSRMFSSMPGLAAGIA